MEVMFPVELTLLGASASCFLPFGREQDSQIVALRRENRKNSGNLGKTGFLLLLNTALTISPSQTQTLVYGSVISNIVRMNTCVDECS